MFKKASGLTRDHSRINGGAHISAKSLPLKRKISKKSSNIKKKKKKH